MSLVATFMRLLSNIPPRPTDRLREQERAKEGGRRPLISAKAIGDGRHGQTEFTPFNPSLRMVDLVTIRTRNAAGIVTFSVAGHDANSTLGAGLAR